MAKSAHFIFLNGNIFCLFGRVLFPEHNNPLRSDNYWAIPFFIRTPPLWMVLPFGKKSMDLPMDDNIVEKSSWKPNVFHRYKSDLKKSRQEQKINCSNPTKVWMILQFFPEIQGHPCTLQFQNAGGFGWYSNSLSKIRNHP